VRCGRREAGAGAHRQLRVASCREPTEEAQHRLVTTRPVTAAAAVSVADGITVLGRLYAVLQAAAAGEARRCGYAGLAKTNSQTVNVVFDSWCIRAAR